MEYLKKESPVSLGIVSLQTKIFMTGLPSKLGKKDC